MKASSGPDHHCNKTDKIEFVLGKYREYFWSTSVTKTSICSQRSFASFTPKSFAFEKGEIKTNPDVMLFLAKLVEGS